MDDLLLKLRILAKIEMVLFRLHLRRTMRQAALALAAVLIAILAMCMLNVALYLYLVPRLDGAGAALAVALADTVVAAAVLLAAGRQRLDSGYDAANDLRERIIADLAAEAGSIRAQVAELHDDIKQIRTMASGILNPGGLNLTSIVQWLVALVRGFRRQ